MMTEARLRFIGPGNKTSTSGKVSEGSNLISRIAEIGLGTAQKVHRL